MPKPYPTYRLVLTALMLGALISLVACASQPQLVAAPCPKPQISPQLLAPPESPEAIRRLNASLQQLEALRATPGAPASATPPGSGP